MKLCAADGAAFGASQTLALSNLCCVLTQESTHASLEINAHFVASRVPKAAKGKEDASSSASADADASSIDGGDSNDEQSASAVRLFFVFNDLILIVENSVTTQRFIIILHCITEFFTNIIIYIYMF